VCVAMACLLAACGSSSKRIQQGGERLYINEGLYFEALALYDGGKFFEAIRAWKDLLDDEPRFAMGHFNLGLIYDELHMVPEAIEHYQRAAWLVEDLGEAHRADQARYNWHLGAAYLRAGLEHEATTALEAAVQRDVYNPFIHYNMAAALMAQGNYEEGLLHADTAVDLAASPDPRATSGLARTVDRNELARFILRQAECHLMRQEWEKARVALERSRDQCHVEPPASMWERLAAGEAAAAAASNAAGDAPGPTDHDGE
jgi:tetratricopeptide (TPR) repeat protein